MRGANEGQGVRGQRDGRRPAARARRTGRDDPDEDRGGIAPDRPRHARGGPPRRRSQAPRALAIRRNQKSGPPRGNEAARRAVTCPSDRRLPVKANPCRIVRPRSRPVHPPCDVIAGSPNGVGSTGGLGPPHRERRRLSATMLRCPSSPVDRAGASSTRWRRSRPCSPRSAAVRAVAPSSTASGATAIDGRMSGVRTRSTIRDRRPRTSAGKRSAGRVVDESPPAPDGRQVGTASSGRGGSTSR